jgi:transketolase
MSIDMRDAFFNGVYDVVRRDKNVMVLTADHGAFGLTQIEKEFPKQFLNVGIAEQNMLSVAAGLAHCGKTMYAYSINNFITMRSLEQVNIDLCGMNLNVNLIGVGAGFTYSTDGPTHQGMQDMQVMSVLPGLSVYNVTDEVNSRKLAEMAYSSEGPKYFRIEKGKKKKIYDYGEDFSQGVSKLSHSSRAYIISTGFMTHTALAVAKKFQDIGVVDVYRIKPLNERRLVEILEGVETVITLEEGTYPGGLGEKVGSLLAKNRINCSFLPIAVEDKPCFHYGTREMLHQKYLIDEGSVCKKIENFLGKA